MPIITKMLHAKYGWNRTEDKEVISVFGMITKMP